MSRRILTTSTGPLYSISITTPDPSPVAIPTIRIQIRNAIDHLRRQHPRWRDFTARLWLAQKGTLSGIASLGTLGPAEVVEKLGSRWPMTLLPIVAEDLRVEVYRTLRRVWIGEGVGRRYQALSIFVGPRRVRAVPERQNVLTRWRAVEPIPVLIG